MKLTKAQEQLINDEIRQLYLFAQRHYEWGMDEEDSFDRLPHRRIKGELEGLADEIKRTFLGSKREGNSLEDIDPHY